MLMRYKGRMGMRKPWQIENMDEGAYKERIRVFMEARDSLFELITLFSTKYSSMNVSSIFRVPYCRFHIRHPVAFRLLEERVLIHAQVMNGACSRT
jgi:hypothetical protein